MKIITYSIDVSVENIYRTHTVPHCPSRMLGTQNFYFQAGIDAYAQRIQANVHMQEADQGLHQLMRITTITLFVRTSLCCKRTTCSIYTLPSFVRDGDALNCFNRLSFSGPFSRNAILKIVLDTRLCLESPKKRYNDICVLDLVLAFLFSSLLLLVQPVGVDSISRRETSRCTSGEFGDCKWRAIR